MKRGLGVAMVSLLCLVASLAGAEEGQTVRIGALFNVTGGQSSLDGPAARGAMLAAREINGRGGLLGKPLELILRDGRTGTESARWAMELLVREDRVAVVVGLSDSTYVLAAGPVAQAAGVPFLTSGATLPTLPGQIGDGLFLLPFGDDDQARALARFVHEDLRLKTVWILTDEASDFTRALSGFFREGFEARAGRGAVLGEATYRTSQKDLSIQIGALRALHPQPDGVMLSALPSDCGRIVRRLRASGVTIPVFSGDGFDTPLLLRHGGRAAEKVWFATHLSYENDDPAVRAFVKAYRQAYGCAPENAFAALGYDAMHLAALAVRNAQSEDPLAIRDALAQVRGFRGITGTIGYERGRRVPLKGVTIIRVEGGKFRFVKEITP